MQEGGDEKKLGETLDEVNRLVTIMETAAG
jgi:hypothetical protein